MYQQHHYGPRVFWLQRPTFQGLLAELCSAETFQPRVNQIVRLLYQQLLLEVLESQFSQEKFTAPTRMITQHPNEGILKGNRLSRDQSAVVLNLARAGTWPSHVCYEELHHFLPAHQIRQDHVMAARVSHHEKSQNIMETQFGGIKIGGTVQGAHVLIPDPMGATGGTIVSAMDHYKKNIGGQALSYSALHLIVTPEYLRRVLKAHPEIVIYTLRVDRGLSSAEILNSEPGQFWDQERGLNEQQYIVPGGGGFGEIMNNSFC